MKEIFIQFINSNANLIQKHPQTHTEIIFNQNIWTHNSPVKLTHKINHHDDFCLDYVVPGPGILQADMGREITENI